MFTDLARNGREVNLNGGEIAHGTGTGHSKQWIGLRCVTTAALQDPDRTECAPFEQFLEP